MLTKEASEIIQKEMTVKQAKGIYKRERLAEKTISDLRYIEVLSFCPDLIDNDWLWQDREARRHAAATGGGPARKFAEMDFDEIPVLDRPTSCLTPAKLEANAITLTKKKETLGDILLTIPDGMKPVGPLFDIPQEM